MKMKNVNLADLIPSYSEEELSQFWKKKRKKQMNLNFLTTFF